MQLRKMTWVLAAMSALAMMTACGGVGGGRTELTCSTDADCLSTELCHPGAKVCVQTCTTSSDCPSSAKTCGAISGSSETRLVCQCSTDALCAQDDRVSGTTLSCSTAYSVCVPPGSGTMPAKCTQNSDCKAGETCDTASGACVAAAGCTKDSDCSSGQACDTSSGACVASTVGQSCSGSSQSTCDYGQYCSTTCAAAPVAPTTCENFSASYPTWSAFANNGPVIYSVTGTYQTNYTYCQSDAPDAFLVKVRAYRTDADWPSARSGVAGFFYLTTGASKIDVINTGLLVPSTGYNVTSGNKRDAEFNLYLCRPSGSQTIQTGFYFTDGNPVCSQINR